MKVYKTEIIDVSPFDGGDRVDVDKVNSEVEATTLNFLNLNSNFRLHSITPLQDFAMDSSSRTFYLLLTFEGDEE